MGITTRGMTALALGLLAGCQPKPETPDRAQTRMDTESAAAKVVIDSLDVEFAKHFNMGHADLVAAFYTEQGHLMAPNMPAAVGRPAITQGLAGMAAMKPDLKLTGEAVVANGPIAIERGTYSFTFTPPGATATMTDTGKYLVHWQLVGGKWLMAEDIWNSDKEPMMPMQAPAKP
jgi:ketosteroid isomerase-like protein